jgi:hypothetical protein
MIEYGMVIEVSYLFMLQLDLRFRIASTNPILWRKHRLLFFKLEESWPDETCWHITSLLRD